MPETGPDTHLAFTRLFVASQPAFQGFLYSLVHDHHAADDLLQELASRLWLKFHDYDHARPFVAWGLGYARFLAMEWRRKQQRLVIPMDEKSLSALADAAQNHFVQHDKRLDALRACIKNLTDRQRRALQLRYEEERTVAEISMIWKRSQVAVYKVLKHCHRVLLACIHENLTHQQP